MNEERARRRAYIEAFADRLRRIRVEAGSPSYRAMAAKSGTISHTTLYEAAAGNRLPSWETTTEFLRSCDVDPDTLRATWQDASAAIHRNSAAAPLPGSEEGPLESPASAHLTSSAPPAAGPTSAEATRPEVQETPPAAGGPRDEGTSRRRWLIATVAVMLVLGCGGAVAWCLTRDTASPVSSPQVAAKDCPVVQNDPPSAPPATAGDRAVFLGDMTVPDCTHVKRGQIVTKIWRIRNAGKVTWRGYHFDRLEEQAPTSCQTIRSIEVPETKPGEAVEIKVAVTAPNTRTFCFGRFKMKNADGQIAFPAGRPINFQIIVD